MSVLYIIEKWMGLMTFGCKFLRTNMYSTGKVMDCKQGMTFGICKYWKNFQNPSISVFYDVFGEILISNNGIGKNLGKFDLY